MKIYRSISSVAAAVLLFGQLCNAQSPKKVVYYSTSGANEQIETLIKEKGATVVCAAEAKEAFAAACDSTITTCILIGTGFYDVAGKDGVKQARIPLLYLCDKADKNASATAIEDFKHLKLAPSVMVRTTADDFDSVIGAWIDWKVNSNAMQSSLFLSKTYREAHKVSWDVKKKNL